MKVKPITPELDKEIWNKWKATIPRTTTLSKAIEDLLIADLKKKKMILDVRGKKDGTKESKA